MFRYPRRWLVVFALTMVVCAGILTRWPPVLGVDFTGGSLLEVTSTADPAAIRDALTNEFDLTVATQATQDSTVLLRTEPLSDSQHSEVVDFLRNEGLIAEELRFESIGPTIGAELRRKAWVAVSIAVVAMVLYLAYTFRQSAGLVKSWKFGVAAAAALLHDIVVVTALFGLLGHMLGATVDTLFVTAMLAIVGYSVNDTIVLFNRLQSEWLAHKSGTLVESIDRAAKATLTRSLNTSITTLLVLVTLLIFGGSTIRWFVVALAAGTIVGTYSSLFIAPPVLHLLARRR